MAVGHAAQAGVVTRQRYRIRSVPLVPALVTGAWSGFVPGLFIGGVVGVAITFGAGAALEWMRQLSFTTGIQQQLLPFGDRIGQLETLQDAWPAVIGVSALAVGLVSALIGVLTGAVVSASYGSLLGAVEVGRRRLSGRAGAEHGYEAPVALIAAFAGLAAAGLSLSIALLMGEQLPTITPGRALTTAIPVELLLVPLGIAVAWMEAGRFRVLHRPH